MVYGHDMTDSTSRAGKLREAARALECHDRNGAVRERVRKLARHKPVEKSD